MTRQLSRERLLLWIGIGLCLAGARALLAQGPQPPVPDLPPVTNQTSDPLLQRFVWRSIGPAVMGGRIDDIAVDEANPSVIYIGYATGGVWKTVNNGTTWTPIFDRYPVSSIGDLAVAPSNPNIVYVGTGEPNNRQSSSFGAGLYKSIDGGHTFALAGLTETQSIARILVHPKNPDVVYVAAIGHLFGPNPERGLYKTTDGGKTWSNVKFIDNDTGFIDLVMHPRDPETLFAASYQRRRVPWGFNGGGPGSGLWKTTDGGRTWNRISGNGLPANPIIGRIGVDICRARPNIVIAQIEVGPSGGTGAGVNEDGSLVPPGQGRRGGGAGGRGQGAPPPPDPTRSGVWRSEDGGKTWRFMSNNDNRPMYYSQIRCDPTNDQIIYTLGASAYKSTDGGKTFNTMGGQSHGDHHALWINPRNSRHLLIGNDGGLDISYDQGQTWEEISTMAVGQFYAISADMRRPYYVCGGLQDNGSWCGPSAVRSTSGILITDWYRIGGGDGFYTANDPTDWTLGYAESQDGNTFRYSLRTGQTQGIRPRGPAGQRGGGPSATAMPDPVAPAPAPQASGAGRGGIGNVVPPPPDGTTFRFFWNTPFILSPHDPKAVLLGGDRLFKSATRGDTWMASPDLTSNIGRNDRPIMGVPGNAPMASKHDGAASYSNIVTLGESPVVPGVLWAGTNDGNLQVSRDDGATWKNVVGNINGVPKETHVSRVEPSHHDAGTCYVSFDGHRADDHSPYVFVTRDYGTTWMSIAGNLPTGNVNVIREDPKNRNLLYVGTEYAVFISLDGGKEWKRFMNGLPTVRVDDLIVHPRDNDLIVGTHGRSIWIIDDITPLQQLSEQVMTADVHLFDVRPATAWVTDTMLARGLGGAKHFRGQNPPGGTAISYYLKSAPSPTSPSSGSDGGVRIAIMDMAGNVVRDLTGTRNPGVNRVHWNLSPNPPPQRGGGERGGRGGGGAAQTAAGVTTPAGAEAATPGAAGAPAQEAAPGQAGRGGGGGGRGGRGGGAQFVNPAAVDPGTYLVKLTIDGKEYIKTVVVEADTVR